MISLARKLQIWRARYRLNQDEAADTLGVPRHTLDKWELAIEFPQGKERETAFMKLSKPPLSRLKRHSLPLIFPRPLRPSW